MIPKDLQNLLERYCTGQMPTDAQMDEIMDMVIAKEADPAEVSAMIETLAKGPTREEMDAKRKAEEEERKRKEAEAAEQKRKEEERKRKEAEQKAERERIEAEKKRKEKEELAKKKAEEVKREAEAAKTAYMNIHRVEFANVKKDGELITDYGVGLNDLDMRYLKPRISYDSLLDKDKEITLYEKIVCPDGSIDTSNNSPEGFTRRFTITVNKGKGQKTSFSGWGSENKSLYDAGDYKYELWYEGNLIYKTSFIVKSKAPIAKIQKIWLEPSTNRKEAGIFLRCVISAKHLKDKYCTINLLSVLKGKPVMEKKPYKITSNEETFEIPLLLKEYDLPYDSFTISGSVDVKYDLSGEKIELDSTFFLAKINVKLHVFHPNEYVILEQKFGQDPTSLL